MQPIEIMYIISGMIALSACVPQLKQLIRTKEAGDLNLQTWAMWSATHMVTLMYVISIRNVFMTLITCAWVAFYICMTCLIIRYRHQPNLAYAEEGEA